MSTPTPCCCCTYVVRWLLHTGEVGRCKRGDGSVAAIRSAVSKKTLCAFAASQSVRMHVSRTPAQNLNAISKILLMVAVERYERGGSGAAATRAAALKKLALALLNGL